MGPAQQHRQDEKNVPGPPSHQSDSGRVAESHGVPPDGHSTSDGLVPAPVQLLSCKAELHDEVAGEILRLDLSAFYPNGLKCQPSH
jgi:hypothetical protein